MHMDNGSYQVEPLPTRKGVARDIITSFGTSFRRSLILRSSEL